ncbi:MAG TPA: class I SAM-dependent methyltransferase [Candidatus Ozemobacteraceae bacterium]|nr:class I SAM-dependent methyltransferase [Candidatus Ozemobacteraceae bacterium]
MSKTMPRVPFKTPYLPENPKIVGVQEGYDLWSEIYDEESNALIMLEQMHLFPELLKRRYESIFDCGCGTGRLAIWLRQHFPGATITGVDFSEGMLSKARHKSPGQNINWRNADLNKPFPFPDEQFDLVVSSLVIEHINNLPNYFGGIRKVARPDADIFISGLHPAMHLLGITARFKNSENNAHILPESLCHSLSDVFNAAVASGLRVSRIEEHYVDDRLIGQCSKAARYEGMPLLFFMKMQRA